MNSFADVSRRSVVLDGEDAVVVTRSIRAVMFLVANPFQFPVLGAFNVPLFCAVFAIDLLDWPLAVGGCVALGFSANALVVAFCVQ